ncbi:MAG: ribosome maturation factor RimM [Syntrophomonadaceae bacterium]|nr:ribosome maturation factor RimM [Syntrophomonadaceae bacterium]MDD3022653.1 ribosome maturation factor RimM [Syntrophomonadaceae bacterium]
MNASELISIGRIAGTYGYAGIVKVVPLTDFPERFNNMRSVKLQIRDEISEVAIESVKPYRDGYLFKFQGIDSREIAQEYQNAHLKIDESELNPLPEGYYYHFQLQGMEVYDEERGCLGVLKEILETGANDVYLIESPKYGEILIPAIKEVILDTDIETRIMKVRLLPGLIDG